MDNFDDSCILKHDNRTGRWLSTFKYDEFHTLSHSLVSNPLLFLVMKLKSTLAEQSGAGMTAIYLLGT